MTDIPEHLLRRSRERRAALGLGGDAPASGPGEAESPAAASAAAGQEAGQAAAATPATRAPAPVAEPKPEPPRPDPVYIQAAKRRRRVPYWAMSVLAALPLWAYVYVRTLDPPPAGENDPFVIGAQTFSANCASCHGAQGQGGAGPAMADGAVQATWPDWRDHMMWVRLGSQGWPGGTYGAEDRAKQGGMPSWHLTDQELAQVVLHERVLGGEDITEGSADYADLLAIARGEKTFAEVGLGPLSQAAGVSEDRLSG